MLTNPFEVTDKGFLHQNNDNAEKTIKAEYDGKEAPANFLFLNGIEQKFVCILWEQYLVHIR